MHRAPGWPDLRTRLPRDDLHSQTNSQNGDSRAEQPHHFRADARPLRPKRPGREHDSRGFERFDGGGRDAIGAEHDALAACRFQALDEIPGERVVIIENQDLQCSSNVEQASAQVQRLKPGPPSCPTQLHEMARPKATAAPFRLYDRRWAALNPPSARPLAEGYGVW